MDINIHNYEEYFLLYADNELSEADRKAVELFAANHPDLKKELDTILLTIQQPEENISLDKSFLLKKGAATSINSTNYSEYFVLYHDNELSAEEIKLTEAFVRDFPEYEMEFELLGEAKLEKDEAIIFQDKQLLYRQSAKVVYAKFYKIAAAAAILGLVFWLGYRANESADIPQIVAQTDLPSQKPSIVTDQKTIQKPMEVEPGNPSFEPASTKEAVAPDQDFGPSDKVDVQEQHEPKKMEEEPHQTLTAQTIAPDLTTTNDLITTSVIPEEMHLDEPIQNSKTLVHADIDITPKMIEQTADVQYAVHAMDLQDNDMDRGLLGMPLEQLKRTKVGGFMKKVKRVIDRNNPINRLFDQ